MYLMFLLLKISFPDLFELLSNLLEITYYLNYNNLLLKPSPSQKPAFYQGNTFALCWMLCWWQVNVSIAHR